MTLVLPSSQLIEVVATGRNTAINIIGVVSRNLGTEPNDVAHSLGQMTLTCALLCVGVFALMCSPSLSISPPSSTQNLHSV